MRHLVVLVFGLIAVLFISDGQAQDKKTKETKKEGKQTSKEEQAKFEGWWQEVATEVNGERIPFKGVKDKKDEPPFWHFVPDSAVLHVVVDNKIRDKGAYELRTHPKHGSVLLLKLNSGPEKGHEFVARYTFKAEEVHLHLYEVRAPGHVPPIKVKDDPNNTTQPKTTVQTLILKRINKK